MKFSINRASFIKALNIVQRAISSKTTIPILTGLKLDVTGNNIMLTGSNADISIQTTISGDNPDNDLKISSTGSIVLPARFFSEIVKKLPDTELVVEVGDNFQTNIKSGNSEFTINGLDANGYPHLPEISTDNSIDLPAEIFKEVIGQTVIAVSKQESRPILTGVHFTLDQNQLLAVATDSHRLSQRKVSLPAESDGAYNIVIPGDSLKELSHMLDSEKEQIKMDLSENQVMFNFGATRFYSRLLEGMYPDTSRLIPDSSATKIQFSAPDLLAAVERASLLSHESRNNVIKLTIKPNDKVVTITGNSPDVGKVEEDLQPKEISGEDLEISFNPDYMKEALRVFGKSDVEVAFTSALRPFTITPTENDHEFIQLITPVRTF
ncbi:DNA polymerase III subunit beta [Lactobacillus sanfranciscensis]|uniref:Beta sliding clamp n=1 Tax=Fructilactobacillus sanfranciscensis (strain TMW 1.1304) TaxID=714313 RepID=G2KT96_FRUST|nr:DNA polymerase III subunit beta [Fructilactobacillus sanfranciscensis]AEN98493.1 DNA polymerase III subunit beta [Fructilactobacillus sanfranciscensis TMW 1.1304]NDR76086.1 DNA polymerase III subunit beta [Fructilactobacillus sanfranciscensis]NDR96771.1 DNA polymerase III subunit beta [Fructilactobacillus sanfranciscensis]NDS04538.1 DNA polymerase III subunit beta [Fructilactobacillus sanfranciscensis]POH17021.1 DNA polymerase III subunit beta [Fructilactobacillus sanfranciscensis]